MYDAGYHFLAPLFVLGDSGTWGNIMGKNDANILALPHLFYVEGRRNPENTTPLYVVLLRSEVVKLQCPPILIPFRGDI